MVFFNIDHRLADEYKQFVTILILIDGFLQYFWVQTPKQATMCHNPYFNRWFSAMLVEWLKEWWNVLSQSLF